MTTAAGEDGAARRPGPREQVVAAVGLLDRPLTSYYLVLGCSVMLLALGLTMVLSASSVKQLQATGSAYTLFQKQAVWVAIGLPGMWLASRLPVKTFRALAYPLLLLSVVALAMVLIPGLGRSAGGATRWVALGPVQIQPSELAKLALVLWGADLLARKDRLGQLTEWRPLLVPLMPGAGVLVLLVMLGSDLGTTLVLLTIFLALLWAVGAPGRLFVGIAGLVCLLVSILVIVEPYRMQRLTGFLDPSGNQLTTNYQGTQGLFALASGGLFGTGLGEGRAKWDYLPHAETDFIFAIVGEEFGLVGTLVVLGLFGLLAYAGLRIAKRVKDPFTRLAAAGATAWVVVQAIVNIGAVIRVLPITGIPLPLVSYGGSALIPTLFALGMLLAFAKREPGARQALSARGPGPVVRALSWLGLARR
ncbi:putative lipid II flippase FtsW [Actinomadura sp. NPDC048955]|uniref:Probable peptidoglycan glycosyltransferase FtsW n=1 Tax=Actinomadura luteofluorescens TaxID=46163 RepID=A0A7Y9JDS0_9ACTN|nr:putative lipid II flippase FtsW [Actinomadura luteofluorescens]NYD45337.1 cell division protein FtsW [Actinomadura luteofluorescens]